MSLPILYLCNLIDIQNFMGNFVQTSAFCIYVI
nr:MAG TPA: hypothetical protein [Caudoviricetes sp.]